MFGFFKKKDPLEKLGLSNNSFKDDFFDKSFDKGSQGDLALPPNNDPLAQPFSEFTPSGSSGQNFGDPLNGTPSAPFNASTLPANFSASNYPQAQTGSNAVPNYNAASVNVLAPNGGTNGYSANAYSGNSSPGNMNYSGGNSGSSPFNVREHELELISSKLDVIRALLDSLNQRLNTFEQRQDFERQKKNW